MEAGRKQKKVCQPFLLKIFKKLEKKIYRTEKFFKFATSNKNSQSMKQRNPQLVGDVIRQAIKDGKLLKALSYERISKIKE